MVWNVSTYNEDVVNVQTQLFTVKHKNQKKQDKITDIWSK